jgi:hypothetical protein
MATRCTYGILNSDGTVKSVSCHFDGYIKGVGRMLFENYNTETKVRELIQRGSVSTLGESLQSSFFNIDRPKFINDHLDQESFWYFDHEYFDYHYLFNPKNNKWCYKIETQQSPTEIKPEMVFNKIELWKIKLKKLLNL